jgi:hypothetical protein
MCKWNVRPATLDDFDWVVDQAEQFMAFADVVPFNAPHVKALVGSFINNHITLIVEREGERVGVAIAMLQAHPLNSDTIVFSEIMWWVVPAHRGTRAGFILFDAMDKAASHYGADIVAMAMEANSPLSGRALHKRGYKAQELTLVKKVK